MHIKLNNQVISLVPPTNGTPYRRLMGGRAFLHNEPVGQEVKIVDVATRLSGLSKWVAGNFVGRDELCSAIAVALATGEHVFAYGPPGTAKSSVLNQFAEGIGGRFWNFLMNPDTSKDEIIGTVDPAALAMGLWKRKWAGITTCDIAFVDEWGRGNGQVTGLLLRVLEERRASSGDEEISVPLLSAMTASNSIPDDKESEAAFDRLLIRVRVGHIEDMADFKQLFTANANSLVNQVVLQSDELRLLAATSEVLAMNLPKDVVEAMVEMRHSFGGQGITDRRWLKTAKAACGQALLKATTTVTPSHLSVARWTLWSDLDEADDIANKVMGICDPLGGLMLTLEATLLEAKTKAANAKTGDDKMEVGQNIAEINGKAEEMLATGRADDYEYRIKAIQREASVLLKEIFKMK